MYNRTRALLRSGRRVYRTAVLDLQIVRTALGKGKGLRCSTAELVARQHDELGDRRLDLFVACLAIEDRAAGNPRGVLLFEKMLGRDPNRRRGDRALLEYLRRSPLEDGLFVPEHVQVNAGLEPSASVAALAVAIARGRDEVDIDLQGGGPTHRRGTGWLQEIGFADDETEAVLAARDRVFERLELLPMAWHRRAGIERELRRLLRSRTHALLHGRGDFYQSCEPLGIRGQRPTGRRFRQYGLEPLLRPSDRVLDIGCNCGFFALRTAPHVESVDAFDVDPSFIAIARAAQRHLATVNCRFTEESFQNFQADQPYDIVFSFAVHHWIGMPMSDYADRIRQLLRPGGIVLLESQDIGTHDRGWDEKRRAFCAGRFTVLREGTLCDDGRLTRAFLLLRDTRAAWPAQ